MEEKEDEILFLQRPIQIVRKFRAQRLTLSIRPDRPIRLTSNMTTRKEEMRKFLVSNTAWIEKNLKKLYELEKNYQKPKLEEGSLFPFLGELKYFIFAITQKSRPFFSVEDGFLICYLPEGFSRAPVEPLLHHFYKKQGVEYVTRRMQHWISVTALQPTKIKFGRATTRWGSCNSKKQINMNWKLICHAPHLIDYVIVHELCHLQFLNHSESFWSLLSEFMPEYRVYEKTLNDETYLSRFLNAETTVPD